MYVESTWDDDKEICDIKVKSGFRKPIMPNQTTHVISIILDAIQSSVGQRLFEGLVQMSINETGLELTFRFSINDEHIAKVEAQIGIPELHFHRGNFMFFVFARVDEIYKLDDSLPSGFQDNLNMPQYIK